MSDVHPHPYASKEEPLQLSHEEIAVAAYYIWQKDERVDSDFPPALLAEENWYAGIRQLEGSLD